MRSRLIQISILAVLSSGVASAGNTEDPIDIGTLPAYTLSRPRDINNHRDVVGQAVRNGVEPTEQAVLWHRRCGGRYVLEALPALPDLVRGDARGFARRDIPIGFSSLIGDGFSLFRAVAWHRDPSGLRVPVDLAPPPGFTDATAFAASAHGQIAGQVQNPLEMINGSVFGHAVVWQALEGDHDRPDHPVEYEVCDLGVPDGFDVSSASGINARGDVVGTAQRFESDGNGGLLLRSDVVVWRKPERQHRRCVSEPILLPSRPDLPTNQNPAINERGDVVVQADRRLTGQPAVSRPLLWARSGRHYLDPVELPIPEGFTDAFATDINARGRVLGTAQVRSATGAIQASRVCVWRLNHRCVWVASLLPNPPGTTLTASARLNEHGDAVGSAPLPPPASSGGLLWLDAASGWRNDDDEGDDHRCDDHRH
jgi:hypothetical protein